MKPTLKTLTVLLVMLLSHTISAQKQKTVQKAIIRTAITCDHCKQCETCGGLLEQRLLKQSGVQMITLDEKAMTITVIYNSKKTDLATIRSAISKLGYDADDVKADPTGYEQLDGCCKA
jgi:periplasmic mercuric ion binding protein